MDKHRALEPLLLISKATGLLPYSSSGVRTGWNVFSTLLLAIVYILKCTYECWSIIENVENKSTNSLLVRAFKTLYENAIPVIHLATIWMSSVNYEQLGSFLRTLEPISNKHYRIPRVHTIAGIIFIFLDTAVVLIFERNVGHPKWHLLDRTSNLITFIIVMQFCSILEIMQYQFCLSTTQLRMERVEVRTFKQLQLIQTTENANKLYSSQNIVIFMKVFCNLVLNGNEASHYIGDFLVTIGLFRSLFYILYHIYIMLLITGFCMNIRREIDRFNKEILKILQEKKNLSENVTLRLYTQRMPTMHFSAGGFFTIGHPLVTSISAAAISFIVILIQFRFSAT